MTLNDWATLAADPRVYRGLEVVHLVGLASLFGGLLLLELRLLGWQRALDVEPLTRLVVPVALGGFALCLVSGLAMFASQPEELWVNNAFRLKLLLIVLAGVNAASFHLLGGTGEARGRFGRLGGLGRRGGSGRRGRAQALASLMLWLAVIVCGRWIAVV
ncbi:hypothetical protein DES44_1870 [Roseateles depolymerans]|uniref:Putative transmembrane protein n=1 Tax=Roseateles depolymerans TaxID=76731 RepID=A0A0U3MWV8_9BURK|nr:Putative transmembrane protein [Roseateles depolymerans]REG19376.1 hypothetical protein DES44_1870 [Roseateles depolymerans]